MTEFYAAKAVAELKDYLEANLQAQLTIVETASGLSAGDLNAPDAYLDYPAPTDPRSPLVQVYEEGMDPMVQREGFWTVPCIVAFTYNGDANVGTDFVKLRRYLTALLFTVLKNPTLSGAVHACILTRCDAVQEVGGVSETRHHYVLFWNVQVFDRVTTV